MERNGDADTREILLLAGGMALIVLGAGLIAAHPAIRRVAEASLKGILPEIGNNPLQEGLGVLAPDVERYLKLRAM
jgi:hypothetical protein